MRRVTGHLGLLGWLTAVWVALWGSVTAANVLGGLVLACVLLVLLPLPEAPHRAGVRPLALLRFALVFAWELVRASATVVVQVLRPRASLRQGVVAVPVVASSDRILTLLANAVSLTPGTLSLEVDRTRRVLYVHVLDVGARPGAVDDVRRGIVRLERLAITALGTAQCRQALAQVPPRPDREVRP